MAVPTVVVKGSNGERLHWRVLALVRDAYRAVGLDPDKYLWVSQGSYSGGSLSGGTHLGNGAADLRVWNLPSSKVEPLVVELRRRNCAAWKRDQAHGGFAPHIHLIVKDAGDLSPSAKWQVGQYDQGKNGLAKVGPDYHPRPRQIRYPWKVRAVAKRTTVGRRGPGEQYKAWKTRKPGFAFNSVSSQATLPNGEVWLKTAFGFWYKAADFDY